MPNPPDIRIHKPEVIANLRVKLERLAREWAAPKRPPGEKVATLEIPLGSEPMTVLRVSVPVEGRRVDPDVAVIAVHAALDAWIAEWPPERCEGHAPPTLSPTPAEDT